MWGACVLSPSFWLLAARALSGLHSPHESSVGALDARAPQDTLPAPRPAACPRQVGAESAGPPAHLGPQAPGVARAWLRPSWTHPEPPLRPDGCVHAQPPRARLAAAEATARGDARRGALSAQDQRRPPSWGTWSVRSPVSTRLLPGPTQRLEAGCAGRGLHLPPGKLTCVGRGRGWQRRRSGLGQPSDGLARGACHFPHGVVSGVRRRSPPLLSVTREGPCPLGLTCLCVLPRSEGAVPNMRATEGASWLQMLPVLQTERGQLSHPHGLEKSHFCPTERRGLADPLCPLSPGTCEEGDEESPHPSPRCA